MGRRAAGMPEAAKTKRWEAEKHQWQTGSCDTAGSFVLKSAKNNSTF